MRQVEHQEPIYIHGPSASFAHTAEDIATYLGAFDEMLDRLKPVAAATI